LHPFIKAVVNSKIAIRTALKEGAMNEDRDMIQTSPLTPAEFAALGTGEVAYLKPMSSEELSRIFPQAPQIKPGLQLFALLSADGAPILVTDSREAATANAWEHDLRMVSVH
jgi:hypothetical protein